MPTAVLFDLDGTLLDIDLDRFLSDYFASLGPVLTELSEVPDLDVHTALSALMSSTRSMCEDTTARSNKDVFDRFYYEATGVDLTAPGAHARIERFYAETFPLLQSTHGPRPGGLAAVEAARSRGCAIAIATNPIFPEVAVRERMRWAGLDWSGFDVVTTYENSNACKPSAAYFSGVADALGVAPSHCLFVGDDAALDMPAAATGMQTFYVGDDPEAQADWRGDLHAVEQFLRDGGC